MMKQLICEMCGSNNLIKHDGVFVCQDCRTKYSVEEAKKMMIEGTVRIDNSHMIVNYLEMARNAYQSSNNLEAESYANKVIELDPTNYKAWLIKGKAAGWQSTLINPRFAESVSAFSNAIAYAPEDEKNEITEDAKTEIRNLAMALISIRGERFAKWPDDEETAGFITDITTIIGAMIQFINQAGVVISMSEMMAPLSTQINQAVVQGWQNTILPDYNGDDNRPDDSQFRTFIERIGFCTTLVEQAINLCDDDDEEDIQRYENLIFLHKEAIDSCSWDYNFESWGKSYFKNLTLTSAAISTRRTMISQCENKIRTIKAEKTRKENAERLIKEQKTKEAAKRQFDKYWFNHANEKADLETELKVLNEQVEAIKIKYNDYANALNNEISEIPGDAEIKSFEERLAKLAKEKEALGIFKGKEKKVLQELIDQAEADMNAVKERMNSAKMGILSKINLMNNENLKEVTPLLDRLNFITNELTKDRYAYAINNREVETGIEVVLKDVGAEKIKVIKVLRELTGMDLKESKDIVDSVPSTVIKNVDKDEANEIIEILKGVGATAELGVRN